MKLITELSVFCMAVLLWMHFGRRPLSEPDRISGSSWYYSDLLTILLGIGLTFAAAFRAGFVDTGVYMKLYTRIGTQWANAFNGTIPLDDYGFNLFMILLNRISSEPGLMVAVTSVLTLVPFLYIMAKYSEDLPFTLLIFFAMSYFTCLNGIRQIMSAALLTLALPWLRDRKWLPYMLLVAVLSTFHASMLVMIPLYFVIAGKRLNRGIWIFLGAVAFCFALPSAADRVLGSVLEDTVYAEYLENESQMGMMRFLVALAPTLLVLLYCWIQRFNRSGEHTDSSDYQSQRMTDVLINMQIVSFGFTALGLQMVYFARISMYFTLALPLLLPTLLRGTFETRSAQMLKRAAVAVMVLYHIYQVYTYDSYGYLNGFYLKF